MEFLQGRPYVRPAFGVDATIRLLLQRGHPSRDRLSSRRGRYAGGGVDLEVAVFARTQDKCLGEEKPA